MLGELNVRWESSMSMTQCLQTPTTAVLLPMIFLLLLEINFKRVINPVSHLHTISFQNNAPINHFSIQIKPMTSQSKTNDETDC